MTDHYGTWIIASIILFTGFVVFRVLWFILKVLHDIRALLIRVTYQAERESQREAEIEAEVYSGGLGER